MHITDQPQDVNGARTNYSQRGIGHNQPAFDEVRAANLETGVWLLCKEMLVTAIQDRRLERGHLRVLATFAQLLNKQLGCAWPKRETIALMSGMSLGAVSNAMSELRAMGYLVSGRQVVPMAGKGERETTVYTFGNIDHEEIRRQITEIITKVREDRDAKKSSPPTVKKKREFTAHGEEKSSPPTVNFTAHGEVSSKSSPPAVKKSSPPTVNQNYIEENNIYTHPNTVAAQAQAIVDWAINTWPSVFNLAKHPGMQVHADVRMWLENNCSEQDDIRPAIEAAALQQQRKSATIGSWSFIQPRVLRRRDDRLTGLTPAPDARAKAKKTPDYMRRY